jgi:basic membrane protein A and related proteins
VLSACGSDNKTSSSSGSSAEEDICKGSSGNGPKIGLAYDVGGRGDQSFNDAAYAGVKKAVDDLDATCLEVKASADDNDTTRAERLRTLAEQGYDPIIGVGFIYSPAASEVAKDYPDTHFAVIDGYSQFVKPYDNLVDLTFAEEQGSFLVGVAAALKTKTKQVGFLGGTHGDLIKKFEAGYTAGVHAIDPKIKVDVKYLTEDPQDNTTGFENPAGGKTAGEGLYDGGDDIVYHAAGKSGIGLFEAAEAAGDGKWAIGVDSDQYLTASAGQKPHILTSMLKRVDVAVFDVISAVKDDKFTNGNVTYDLKSNGVGYSTSGGFIDDIKGQIDQYAAKIKSGAIKVPTVPKG